MEDFLSDNYSVLTKAVIFLATLVGLITLKKFKQTEIRYFIYFLVYVLFLEIIAYYPSYFLYFGKFHLIEGTLIEKNYWWYNTFWAIGSALFYSFYFEKIVETRLYKKTLNYSRKIFLAFALGYIIFNTNLFFYSSIVVVKMLGAIVVLLSTTLFFVEILKSEKVLVFYKSINFYIAATVFVWFLIRTPIVFYDVYFTTNDWDYVILKAAIILITNIFMYLTFSIVLLWCKPQNV